MQRFSKVKQPFTPVRRLFHGVFSPSASVIGKRGRDDTENENNSPVSRVCNTHSSAFLPPPILPPNSYCIALLNEVPADDAVIVTALTEVPFCCHADLLTMTRTHLVGVALKLNTCLPAALHIDLDPARSDAYIRGAIELLVGLRSLGTPLAPKPLTRARSLHGAEQEPPVSPLAGRARESPLLVVHEVENEADDEAEDVPLSKRRRMSPSPSLRLARALTERQTHTLLESPSPGERYLGSSLGVSRSVSDREICVDRTFITTQRPRRRYRPRGIVKTSTPKKGAALRPLRRETRAIDREERELTARIDGLSLATSWSGSLRAMDVSV